jgi:hypothetical protein
MAGAGEKYVQAAVKQKGAAVLASLQKLLDIQVRSVIRTENDGGFTKLCAHSARQCHRSARGAACALPASAASCMRDLRPQSSSSRRPLQRSSPDMG